MPDRDHPLKPDSYRERLLDHKISQLLGISTSIDLRGARGAGKTWCALAHAKSIVSADDETIAMPLIQMDARIALTGPRPHAVDEWAAFPDLVRQAAKASKTPGSFLLLTSCEPARETDVRGAKPAGVARTRLRMRTLTLAERGLSSRAVSLGDLVSSGGTWPPLASREKAARASGRPVGSDGMAPVGADGQAGEAPAGELAQPGLGSLGLYACEGGWAAAAGRSHEDALVIARNQVDSLLAGDVRRQGRKGSVARAILACVELATGCDTSYASLAERATEAGLDFPSRNTLGSYARTFEQLYLLERLPGWAAPVRSASRVKTKPRLVVADPSLGVMAAGLGPRDLAQSAVWLGAAFRALALHDLLAYAEALPAELDARVCYYADADGLAVDAVLLLGRDGWAPACLAMREGDAPAAIRRLARLERKVAAGGSALGGPAFKLVVTPGGAPWRDERTGTVVAPVTSLTA